MKNTKEISKLLIALQNSKKEESRRYREIKAKILFMLEEQEKEEYENLLRELESKLIALLQAPLKNRKEDLSKYSDDLNRIPWSALVLSAVNKENFTFHKEPVPCILNVNNITAEVLDDKALEDMTTFLNELWKGNAVSSFRYTNNYQKFEMSIVFLF